MSVQEAFHEFAEHGYRHLPVVDDDKLVGIISRGDVVRAILRDAGS